MGTGKIVLGGIVFAVIAQVIHSIEAIATMDYYLLEEYWPVWSKVMMPGPGPPPMQFYAYSIAFAVATGIIFAAVYSKIKASIPGATAVKKGSYYGAMLFLVAGIPFGLTTFLLINLPAELLAIWSLTALIVYLLGGIAIAKLAG